MPIIKPATQIVMVTTVKMPKPDLDSSLLIDELEKLGIFSQIIPWDSDIDWAKVPMVLLRTPWDYFQRAEEFLNWAEKVDKVTKLLNPFELVKWNAHKSYLLDLEQQGVPIIPTILIRKNEAQNSARIFNSLKFDEMVIKPAISGGAVGALMAKKSDPQLFTHLNELLKTHDVLIQPFISNILDDGEVSLIYFAGKFSHAIHKKGAKGEYRVQEEYGGSVHLYNPTLEELELSENILSKTKIPATYARVDLVKYEGKATLMEFEIIEPELFLKNSPEGTRHFAEILKALITFSSFHY
jgi:glutathione synthase/RimK-type ligase-like ATP-grasp enzyme